MKLGQNIKRLRKEKGISQEALADAIGVSRQAVSKWETGATYPDTENLLALAKLFGITVDELAETKTNEKVLSENKWHNIFLWICFIVIIIAVIITVFLLNGEHKNISDSKDELPLNGLPESEFMLVWGETEFLTLGTQASLFPFGKSLSLSAIEEIIDTDVSGVKLHHAVCATLDIKYLRFEENESERDTVISISTITPEYATSRGIYVGCDEKYLLDTYGDTLFYVLKQTGEDILCQHDYLYVYTQGGTECIEFFIDNGHVVGLNLFDMIDGEPYTVNNQTIFPVKNGEPDFSQRQETETEEVDNTRVVYIALNSLKNDRNLSSEDEYRLRKQLYENLEKMDWQEFGMLGEAGQEMQTQQELLTWLQGQQVLSESEIMCLMMGYCRSNPDGWLSDGYCVALAKYFLKYPQTYVELLASEEFSAQEQETLIRATGYGSDVPEDFHQQCVDAMYELLYKSGALYGEAEKIGIELYNRLQNPQ